MSRGFINPSLPLSRSSLAPSELGIRTIGIAVGLFAAMAALRSPLLAEPTLAGVAAAIQAGRIRKIGFLTGAGVSVAAGIPDFRSPGGMYDTLRPELLTATPAQRRAMAADPVAVVTWDLFRANPLPYLEVRRPFILGTAERRWKATLAHWFARLCDERGLLQRVFTQNIDGLDAHVGVPDEKLVACHGSIATPACEFCGAPMAPDAFRAAVRAQVKDIYGVDARAPATSTPIACGECGKGGVKPTTVLYGRNLPRRFFECAAADMPELDLLVVAGTSLTVHPAASLVTMVSDECARLVINLEPVGADLGIEYGGGAGGARAARDVFAAGTCDAGFLELARLLGWLPDLAAVRDRLPDASAALLDEALEKEAAANRRR